MRIAIFSDTFLPQVNGVAGVVRQSADALARRGHFVHVFTVSKTSKKKLISDTDGKIGITLFPSLPFVGYKGERMAAPLGLALPAVRKFKPDIMHAHTPFAVGWEAVMAAKIMKVPLVGTHHTFYDDYLEHIKLDYNGMRKISWKVTVTYYNRCELVLSPTRSLAAELKANGLERPVEIIPNPVDTELFKPISGEEKLKIREKYGITGQSIVYMGRLSYEKNINILIEAFAQMAKRRNSLNLMIIGDGPERKTLEKKCIKTGVGDKIIFTGMLHGKELAETLAANDVFATASKSENMPLAILEAMACGLPVVAVAARGIPEIIQDGTNGLLAESDGADELAEKILRIINNNELAGKLSECARRSSQNYSQAEVARLLESFYQKELAKAYESVPVS